MSTTKINIPGTPEISVEQQPLRAYFPEMEIQSYALGTLRNATEPPKPVELETQDIVIISFENNIQWIHNGGEFINKLQYQQLPTRNRDTDGLTVPLYWQNNDAPARGFITSTLKLLGIHIIKKLTGRSIASEIAQRIEQNNPNILYKCDENFNLLQAFDPAYSDNATGKYLLLIHGTGSNTKIGFGGLTNGKTGNLYKLLYNNYEGRILAYEHKTFTQSPVKNVLELLNQFPDNITLDLITHSRGGLLGEVLARISSESFDGAFTSAEINLLNENEDAKILVSEIKELNKLSGKKQLKINQFIRVACPAAGTTLVSDRADKMLNVLFNILSNIPGEIPNTIIEGLKALLIAVVNEKNSTDILPGIECMKPDSAFIKVLNFKSTAIDSDLVVVAGDAQGEGFISKIKMMLVDAFYQEDNDLVVNMASMKKGTGRKMPFLIYDEQAGNLVHFNYFINDSIQKIIQQIFIEKNSEIRGAYSSMQLQHPVAELNVIQPKTRSAIPIERLPVLYVLPGIMGSNLMEDQTTIWLNHLTIAAGGLKRLALTTADNITASGINGSSYNKLVDYFSNDYYVIPFAYDWRKSIYDAAKKLNDSINERLLSTDKTISFVAHSIGGLVLKAFITDYSETWEKITKRNNCRVLMLGTPNSGSYVILRLLMGMGKSINTLAALDITSSKKKLLQQFVRYSGLLELLPVKGKDDFSKEDVWKSMLEAAGLDYAIPQLEDMNGYLEMQKDKFRNFRYDPSIVKYIAGKDDRTPNGYDTENGRLNFYATPQGDGSVTWDTIPTELLNNNTYFIDAEHGSLAKHAAAFEGYKELLEQGETNLLSKVQPLTRGIGKSERMPDEETVPIPDEYTLQQAVLGIIVPQMKTPAQQVKVFITNGDLGHATYPVMAGHFSGDAIVEAERILDGKLNNYLSRRHATNNYPADIGTHEVILKKNAKSAGAIIVGLGDFGTLTENNLSQTLKQALLSYVIKSGEDTTAETKSSQLGISYLLIGSGYGGLSISSSIRAILNAVKETNHFFDNEPEGNYKRIGLVEIIELYQYKAIQAGRVILFSIINNSIFRNIIFKPDIIKRASGARNEIPDKMQASWWQRLKITCKEEEIIDGKKISRSITFSSITDRARSEENILNTNTNIVDKLIAKAASVTNNNKLLCQTLYELLVPNNFKGFGADLRSTVLILDKETARYPWEMLLDAYSNNKEPIVVKTGFLRQLSTGTYRQNTKLTTADNALVIGNPELNNYYPSLPGAAREALQVSDKLSVGGYQVKPFTFINTDAHQILPYLYTQPFKILHIAAHGVLRDKKTGQTGVVLGPELILTAADFEQMRNVPELVFINCCSLGTVNKEDEERLQRKYQVAAGIGTQLIEMGVKAVIVAGWEVDDAAAACFSDTFYGRMLGGENYGNAVKEARTATYANYPGKNTWGAYQCYGDPYYSLRNSSINNVESYQFCDSIEAINKLQNLISEVETASTRDEKKMIEKEIGCVVKAINEHPEWKQNAMIIEQLADLYKELGNYAKATTYYEQLFSIEDANYKVKTIEQYCKAKIKHTIITYKDEIKSKPSDRTQAVQDASTVINEMIAMLKNINIRPTSERMNLLGSAYRRLADVNSGNLKLYRENLIQSAKHYYLGFNTYNDASGKAYHYPLYNWLIISAVIKNLATKAELEKNKAFLAEPDNLDQIMQNASSYATELNSTNPDFWYKTADSAQYLFRLIKAETVEEIDECKNNIIENHLTAWSTEGSVNKGSAISEHARFVISMFENYKAKLTAIKLLDHKLQALVNLAEKLEKTSD